MIEGLVTGAVTTLGTWAAMRWLLRGTAAPPPVEGEALALRYSRAVLIAGWGLVAVVAALAAVGSVAFGTPTVGEGLALLGVAVAFAAPGLLLVLGYRREWVHVTPTGVEGQTALARVPTSIAWGDVARVRFGRMSGYLTIRATDGRTVRVSAFLSGVEPLGHLVGRNLADRGGAAAAAELVQYRAAYGG